MDGGWNDAGSPFHPGEHRVQERAGVRDKLEAFGRRVIRDYLPEEHRQFYPFLPFLLVGAADDRGRPWATMLAGQPGFVSSPDPRRLRIAARPPAGDPLGEALRDGAEVGVLGIQLESRRRNRLTGRVERAGPGGFEIAVKQTFGNCPQYIQTRTVTMAPDTLGRAGHVHRSDQLDDAARALIERVDTLFIATAYAGGEAAAGADVSHRGGRPGFVRIDNPRTFVFPDFSGNFHFNTVGNIVENPRAGVLFVDFETGDLLSLTGAAEIVWDGPEVQAFKGAERLIRCRVEEVVRMDAGLPLRFTFGDYSPMLEQTGSWQQAAETIAADRERGEWVPYAVTDVRPESAVISSFLLRRADGRAPASYAPGQYLPIRLTIPGRPEPVTRTYTLSDAADGEHYRLSIKREDGGLASSFLHDAVAPGDRLEAMAPRGTFVLDETSGRPVVLISAGVGVTPMIAMLNHIVAEGRRTRGFRKTFFLHGAANGRVHAFGAHLRTLAAEIPSLDVHVRYSRPDPSDRPGVDYDSTGRIDMDLLKSVLPFDDYDFYLCGPAAFMQDLFDGLTGLGVRAERIRYESFGPATVLAATPEPATASDPVTVHFAETGIDVTWSPGSGTLLETAEAAGLSPAFACRSGICGTCATRIACGAVDYLDEPVGPHADDEVLICCSTPRSTAGGATCGEDRGVVLHL